MKKLGVVITDGVGFRNFILSDFLAAAEKAFDEVVILSFLPASAYEGYLDKSRVIELPAFEERFKTWFFRKAKELAHLQLHRKGNFGIGDNFNTNRSRAKNPRGFATRFLFRLTALWHSEKWINRFNSLQQLTFKAHEITDIYYKILKQENFGLLFFTHQRPPFIAPLAFCAQKLKVKTCSFIFSWDNLASKGRMAANFDRFLVWSDLMKQELLQFYTSVKSTDVEIAGAPQFEPYVLQRYQSSKAAFYHRFSLDGAKKTACFSCGDISTSGNDELYISIIARAMQRGDFPDMNLIVRTSPAEDPVRFAGLAKLFPFITWNHPKWELARTGHQEAWSQRIPSAEDVRDLRSLLEFSDLNINMLSTMSLDFMQFGKPVINPVFGNRENGLYNDQRFLQYAHIKSVIESKATRIATNEQELLEAISVYLSDPGLDKENREHLVQLEVGKPLGGTSQRIVESLARWM